MLDETVYRNAATSHESRPAAQNLSRTVTVIVTALSQLVHYTRIYGGTLWNDHRSSGVSEAYSDTGRHPALRTVNPSAYAYSGSNPLPATLVRGYFCYAPPA